MVIGRLISGVHWLTDIIGGVLLSAGIVMMYYTVTSLKEKWYHTWNDFLDVMIVSKIIKILNISKYSNPKRRDKECKKNSLAHELRAKTID